MGFDEVGSKIVLVNQPLPADRAVMFKLLKHVLAPAEKAQSTFAK